MRPIPWIIRVGLFAVGFGAGLSHYKPVSTPQPVTIELRLVHQGANAVLSTEPVASVSELLPCSNSLPDPQILSAKN